MHSDDLTVCEEILNTKHIITNTLPCGIYDMYSNMYSVP